MERVTDLVDRALLALPEPAGLVERFCLEEEPDLVARFQKITILRVVLAGGREDRRDLTGLERLDQRRHPPPQRRAFGLRDEAGQDEITVALEPRAFASGNHDPCLRPRFDIISTSD